MLGSLGASGVPARTPGVKARPGGAPGGPGAHAGVLLATPGPAPGAPVAPCVRRATPGFGGARGRLGAPPAAPTKLSYRQVQQPLSYHTDRYDSLVVVAPVQP